MGATEPRAHTVIHAIGGTSRYEMPAASSAPPTMSTASPAENPGSPSAKPTTNASASTATVSTAHHAAATTSFATTNQCRPTGSASMFLAVASSYSRPKT